VRQHNHFLPFFQGYMARALVFLQWWLGHCFCATTLHLSVEYLASFGLWNIGRETFLREWPLVCVTPLPLAGIYAILARLSYLTQAHDNNVSQRG
jgi:hypothetical protein